MTLVAVVNILLNAELIQSQHTTDTQQNLLFQTVLVITTIQLMRNRTIPFAIEFIVRVQQIQTDTTNSHTPQVRMNRTIRIRHVNNHRRTVSLFHLLHRQILEVLCLVISNLLTFRTQRLCEIAVTVQETDSRHVHIAIRCFLQIVSGQNTQTTAVYLQNMRQTIFHREISYRRLLCITWLIHISTELRIHVVQTLHKRLVLTQLHHAVKTDHVQQHHRIRLRTVPSVNVDITEQVLRIRVPYPPQIVGNLL